MKLLKLLLLALISTVTSSTIIAQTGAQFPSRPADAIEGSAFMESIKDMSLKDREGLIFEEISTGNMPSFCKEFKTISGEKNGKSYTYQTTLDYLAVGSDNDFCRVPISPGLAQKIADYFGCTLPTTKMVDENWQNANRKIQPITHTPNGNDNEQVWMFVLHNQEIESALEAIGGAWDRNTTLVDGLKKDIVITNKIISNPGKVAIYGWYKLDGSFWQPLYTGHIDTYMDYSHGVRLINNLVTVEDDSLNLREVLKTDTLYSLFSNETGIMIQPYYLYEGIEPLPDTPKSFGIKTLNEQEIQLSFSPVDNASEYVVHVTSYIDGTPNTRTIAISDYTLNINGLSGTEKVEIKLKSKNSSGESLYSEVLTVVPGSITSELLIVQGFDRKSTGNTFDFMKYHASSALNAGIGFDAATNDAVIDGLFNLVDYTYVDYVLGEESTVDETFNSLEQEIVKQYLNNGGNLLVSGAEIAWDLDWKGSATDRNFYHNYLKASYQYDAPFNTSGIWYTVKGIEETLFGSIVDFQFDNGTHGTFNVKYADQLTASGGSNPIMEYVGSSPGAVAGIAFTGLFPKGVKEGKLVNLGFPLETVYPDEERNELFQAIVDYFNYEPPPPPLAIESKTSNEIFSIAPMPSKGVLNLFFNKSLPNPVEIYFYNNQGIYKEQLYHGNVPDNSSPMSFNVARYPSGVYVCVLQSKDIYQTRKVVLVK
ncbi:MAG: hypothetical protein ABFS32_02780 [Bacteroidota bacterium]